MTEFHFWVNCPFNFKVIFSQHNVSIARCMSYTLIINSQAKNIPHAIVLIYSSDIRMSLMTRFSFTTKIVTHN